MTKKTNSATVVAATAVLDAAKIFEEALALKAEQKNFTLQLNKEELINMINDSINNVANQPIVGISNSGKCYAFYNTSFKLNNKSIDLALFASEKTSSELCKAKAACEIADTKLITPKKVRDEIIHQALVQVVTTALVDATSGNATLYVMYDADFGQFKLVKKYQYEKANKVNQVVLPVLNNKEGK